MVEQDILIIAWEKLSPREKSLSEYFRWPLLNPKSRLKYLGSALRSLFYLLRFNPKIVIIQLPQGPLLLFAIFSRYIMKYRLIVDMHSGFLVYSNWKGTLLNKPFKFLLKYVDLIIIHNQKISDLLDYKQVRKSIVVYDPLMISKKYLPKVGEYILFVTTFFPDEDIETLLKGYLMSDKIYPLYITGDYKRKLKIYSKYRGIKKIRFLGWLSDDNYERYLSEARGVVTSTTREYTMQRAIWEAASYEKPVIIPDTETIREVVNNYGIFYKNRDLESIKTAFNTLQYLTNDELTIMGKELAAYLKSKSIESLELFSHEISKLYSSE